jgi:threonine synthase
VHPTISPSMDIQVSSNLERLLFELYERNPLLLADRMAEFRAEGRVETGDTHLASVTEVFDGAGSTTRRPAPRSAAPTTRPA